MTSADFDSDYMIHKADEQLTALLQARYGDRWEEMKQRLEQESKQRPPSDWWERGCGKDW